MALPIISAAQRLSARPKINIALFGPSGIGKTTLARTLDPERTLFLDGEAGTLALGDWAGDVLDMRKLAVDMGAHPWEMARTLACMLSGPDPVDHAGPYSKAMYELYVNRLGNPEELFGKYDTIFLDSITVCGRWSLEWSRLQPQAMSEKTGKPDMRSAYGLHGQEMVRWLTVLQHSPKSIVVVGILDRIVDELKRASWEPQIDGSKAGRELPGIFDQVLTLANMTTPEGVPYRALVCHQNNQWGFPAKDRTGKLELIEEPHLGKLLAKIANAPRLDQRVITEMPPVETAPAKTAA